MVAQATIVLFFAAILARTDARTVRYDGEIVVRCQRDGAGVAEFLQQDFVDVWKVTTDGLVDVRVSRERYEKLVPAPQCNVVIENVEVFVQRAENLTARVPDATWFEEYHGYSEIVEWYRKLAEEHGDLVRYVASIGKSLEGRDQPAVHIGKGGNRIIYFQCQIHAREWISGATCNYIASYLVENYGENKEVTDLLDEVQFIFVPFVNPDGYEYTRDRDRLWRKNRSVNSGSSCHGTDLNRNYNDHWGGGGSSSSPCSETYMGSSAASEPETKNTANYFKSIQSPIIGAIDWHSFSQLILRPYGWTRSDSPDEAQLKELGDDMSTAIYNVHGKRYTSQKSIDLYITTGTASDWFYSEDANVNNDGYRAAGFTIELRDTGTYGFLLPPSQIIPTGDEMLPAVLLFAKRLNENPLVMKR